MKQQNGLTHRKKAESINDSANFEELTKKIREESLVVPPESIIKIDEDLGLSVTIEKCIDEVKGNNDTVIKVESAKDFNYIKCEPSEMNLMFDRLADIGCVINRSNQDSLMDFIKGKLESRDLTYTYKKLGWGDHLGQKVIKLSSIEAKQGTITSEYVGGLSLNKKGSLDEYVQTVKRLIIGHSRLELALVCGVCGLIVQELDESDTNIVINYYGKSSLGKTQTSKIPLTLFGDPNKLFKTFNSTENKLEKDMAEYQVLPFILDDKLVGTDGKRRTEVIKDIFTYATGHVKGRMNDKEASTRYYCPIFMSTEESVLDIMKSSSTKGQFFRMFEIPCERGDLTISKEHSKQIEKFMRSNHGVAGETFAKWLLEHEMYGEKLNEKYYNWHEKLENDFDQVDRTSRIANRMAVIMLAGELMEECFKFGIDLNIIQQLLMSATERAFSKVDQQDVYYTKLKKYIAIHQKCFASNKNVCDRYKHFGQYKKNEYNDYELWVEPRALKYILSGKKPDDYFAYLNAEDNGRKLTTIKKGAPIEQTALKQILGDWKSKGWLTSGRVSGNTTTHTSQKILFNGDKQRNIYIINFKEEE